MAIEWKFDLLNGQAKRTSRGWQTNMLGIATGVDNVAGFAKLFAACQIQHGCPQIGDPHPAIPTAYLFNIELISVSSEDVKARFFYEERWTDRRITINTVLVQEQTNLDINGDVISTTYTYPDDYKLDDRVKGSAVTQGGFISTFVPHKTIQFDIRQLATIEFLADNFIKRTNLSDWREPGDKGLWLCMDISGMSPDSGINWDNKYAFEKRDQGWEGVAVFIDPNTNQPPPDVEDGTGIVASQIYGEADFSELPL